MSDGNLPLFGGEVPWSPLDWTDVDDRVRGGKSQSYFSANASEPVARFYGNLDIDTLGGAGFASQATTGDRSLDLHKYDGIELDIEKADDKRYTLNLKDDILPPDPESGREQSSVSYEYDFYVDQNGALGDPTRLRIPWSAFKATYRGRGQPDAPALNTKDIKRLSFMMRSFFGTQQGPFSLSIRSVSAYADAEDKTACSGILRNARSMKTLIVIGAALIMTGVYFGLPAQTFF